MLSRLITRKDEREGGFTLIELLVVVAIIGILAAIAIPVFLNQRAAARDASVKSDINTVAKVMETYYTTNQAYPTGIGANAGELPTADEPPLSSGNAIYVANIANGFTITGCNAESDAIWFYDSTAGGLEEAPATGKTCTKVAAGASQLTIQ